MSFDLKKYIAVAERWEHSANPVAAAAACLIVQLCDEVARLRMTDAEQRALGDAADILEDLEDDDGNSLKPEADTLRGLRERHAKGGET